MNDVRLVVGLFCQMLCMSERASKLRFRMKRSNGQGTDYACLDDDCR